MIVTTPHDFRVAVERLPPPHPVPPLRGVLMVRPDGFRVSYESLADNTYMTAQRVDEIAALEEHAAVVRALRAAEFDVHIASGDPCLPDACFPNNAYATTPGGRVIYGAMRHADRAAEPRRREVRGLLEGMGYLPVDLGRDPSVVAELTGSLVIDHARNIGYCGMTERVNDAGARAMASSFGLDLLYQFDLAPGEYHTNVVLAILAGRAAVIAPDGFADPADAAAIAGLYGERVLWLDAGQRQAFAGNLLALGSEHVALSSTAAAALGAKGLRQLQRWGFEPIVVPITELEKGGGSMRCLICELW